MSGPRLACDAERLYSKRPLYTSLGVFLHMDKTDGRCAEVIKVQLCFFFPFKSTDMSHPLKIFHGVAEVGWTFI